ncbi:MAG: YibE/F family protein [Candidatus Pacebacteria bacterium]|nr:YibE/F family protein [Candidatus Paceibacterota bacterium]
MKKIFLTILFLILSFSPILSYGSEIVEDKIDIVKAKVIEVGEETVGEIPGLDIKDENQLLKVEILEGENKGEIVTVSNDFNKLEVGDIFFLNHTITAGEEMEYFFIQDSYRLNIIIFFLVLFVVLVVTIGGIQGIRGLLSLAGSLILIIYVLLPGIMSGYPPMLVSIVVSSFIIVLGSYITHGFNRVTTSAVFGMILTVIITGVMGYIAIHLSRFSGYVDDEVFYLNLNTKGTLDLIGLLMSGIMIGLLGVLYDAAIGQAVAVEELHKVAPHLPKKTIFKRAMRIGREHIGALVDTLAIAYVGASLPLLLLFFSVAQSSISSILNGEIFATEIMRILIGSIGLILAVPITTLISSRMLVKESGLKDESVVKEELEKIEHFKHSH